MKAEVIGWVATAVGTPIVIVTLCWTLVIFHCHRQYWRGTDLLMAAVLSQGVVKQAATFAYTVLALLQTLDSNEAWCSGIVWLLTSIHTLQAGTLATLVFSRLLALRSPVRYRQAVKRTHIVYHLVSLSILSACIGVAAVLAESKRDAGVQEDVANSTVATHGEEMQHCTFLPHEMDRRYAVLSVTLHSLLDVSSVVAIIVTLFSWCCLYRRQKSNISVSSMTGGRGNHKRQLLTSSSDVSAMSDMSVTSTRNCGSSKGGNVGVSGKCTSSNGLFMHGLLASHLRYIDSCDGKPRPPKATSLDGLPTVSCSSGVGAGDRNCFRPNANIALGTEFPSSSSCYADRSTDTLKSCAVISNYSHTAPKSLIRTQGPHCDEIYGNSSGASGSGHAEDGCRWTSESSYVSTSTSSTNSRAPCLARQSVRDEVVTGLEELRLSSVVPVLVLCYAVNHLPVLGLTAVGMFAPSMLPQGWSLPALVLWAGVAEEFLLPILLSLCDGNFTAWVANIYTCRDRRVADLARQHQGLDGKFRVFGTQSQHQPEIQGSSRPQSQHQHQHLQQEPVKFPITNGSLFTSVDGRLPIIHNYRRGKGVRTRGAVPSYNINVGLPGAQALINFSSASTENQHSDIFKRRICTNDDICKLSRNFSEFEVYLPSEMDSVEKKLTDQVGKNSTQQSGSGNLLTDFGIGNLNSQHPSSDCEDDSNSEDLNEYNVDDDDDDEPIYATLSSRSCCSATTAANDDFEFFQHEHKASRFEGAEKHFTREPQSEEGNCGQSLLYGHRRETLGHEDNARQSYRCADENSEVLKLVLPLIQSYQNNNNTTRSGENRPRCQNASEILKAVIQNELGNNKCDVFLKNSGDGTSESKRKISNSCNHQTESQINSKNFESTCVQDLESEDQKGAAPLGSRREHLNSRIPHVGKVTRKQRAKKGNNLPGSLSLNNLDQLLLEEDDGVSRSGVSPQEKTKNESRTDSSDEREVVLELPLKSESVLSLYQLELDRKSSSGEPPVINAGYKEAGTRPFCKQIRGNDGVSARPTPLLRRSGHQIPPARRLCRQKLPAPVLSFESLTTALSCAAVSYLDNGDLCRHGSVPDLQRVFVSDYI